MASNASALIGAWAAQGSPASGTVIHDGKAHRVTVHTKTPPRVILDFAQRCNLRCGFCPVWGRDPLAKEGLLDYDAALRIMDQLPARTVISPSWYGEPLLIPRLREVFEEMRQRGFIINMNTNGLTLDAELASFFCGLPVDAIMVSLDAARPLTLKLVRGIWALEKIEAAVMRLLAERGERLYPRIGVSFTIQEGNRHDLEEFKARWIGAVDVVRIGLEYRDGRFPEMHAPAKRVPCPLLYETMVIRHDGSVPICCLDSTASQVMGHVQDGVCSTWNGEKLEAVRTAHEHSDWEAVPFCKNCNGWADKVFTEKETEGILIRESPQYTYYNRKDRLENWKR